MRACDNCGAELQGVFRNYEPEGDQYHNVLPVHLDGGYGMFYDYPISGDAEANYDERTKMLKVVLCHDCAHRLCHAFPSIGKLLDRGHMDPAGGFKACPLFVSQPEKEVM